MSTFILQEAFIPFGCKVHRWCLGIPFLNFTFNSQVKNNVANEQNVT